MHDYQSIRQQFLINPDITFLNFGSFGACPKPVFEVYQQIQKELEWEPVRFLARDAPARLELARKALGEFVHAHPDDLVYVLNPSWAVNAVGRSLKLEAGDEVLTTNIEYGACDKAWMYFCKQGGAHYIQQPIHFPVLDQQDIVESVISGITPRTRLIFISHITSATGFILPVAEICKAAQDRGIPVFIDGAHTPGHIPLDLNQLNPDYYTGACHKWMMTPKGSSFLYAKKERQAQIDPLIISWGYDAAQPSHSQFLDYHQVQGTRDISAFLSIPAAIQFRAAHDWEKVSESCKQLVRASAGSFCEQLDTEPHIPIKPDFLGQMFSIPINTKEPERLQNTLYEQYQIEIPVMHQNGKNYLRYSVQGFNGPDDLNHLKNALLEIRHQSGLLD
jgi:isopenicillin-N epimerase